MMMSSGLSEEEQVRADSSSTASTAAARLLDAAGLSLAATRRDVLARSTRVDAREVDIRIDATHDRAQHDQHQQNDQSDKHGRRSLPVSEIRLVVAFFHCATSSGGRRALSRISAPSSVGIDRTQSVMRAMSVAARDPLVDVT